MSSWLREHSDPWAAEIVDVETLHQAASDAIVHEVDEVCREARAGRLLPTRPARLLLGPPGIGKTHLFARLSRRVRRNHQRVTLVHLRPTASAAQTPRMLLGQIFEQLRQRAGERMQFDLLVGYILGLATGANHRYPNMTLVDTEGASPEARSATIERAVEVLVTHQPTLDASASYLEAFLQAPFREGKERRAWLSWLEGREIDEAQARRFGVPPPLAEDQILPTLRALATVAAPTSPLLLVFDQLENLIDGDGHEPRVRAYGRLLMDLVDTVPGLVLVQMAVESDWTSRIEPAIDGAQRSRLSVDAGSPRRMTLAVPTEQERRRLVEEWRKTISPAPVRGSPWPFSAARMTELERMVGLTPRMLLQYFQEALVDGDEGDDEPRSPPSPEEQRAAVGEVVRSTWHEHLEAARERLREADEREGAVDTTHLLDGLLGLARLAQRPRLTRVANENEVVDGASGRRVTLVHSENGTSTAAQLRRVVERSQGHEAGWLALRERWRPLPASWTAANDRQRDLEKAGRVRWSWLERDEVVELLALRSMLMDLQSHDVNGPDGKPLEAEVALERLRTLEKAPLERLRAFVEGSYDDRAIVPPAAPSGPAGEDEGKTKKGTEGVTKRALEKATTSIDASAPATTRPEERGRAGASRVVEVMERLRVASIARVVDELGGEAACKRKDVQDEVKKWGGRLRMIGASIVVLVDRGVSS